MLEMWYMKTREGSSVGPLELHDLVKRISMTPDTLVRKADEEKWTPGYAHPDLKTYLKPTKPKAIDEEPEDLGEKSDYSDVLVVDSSRRLIPPGLERWLVWIILGLLLLIMGKTLFD